MQRTGEYALELKNHNFNILKHPGLKEMLGPRLTLQVFHLLTFLPFLAISPQKETFISYQMWEARNSPKD